MSFAAPAMLGFLALLPVVVLLHLLRRREKTVGSLLVWRRIADQLAPRTVRSRNLKMNVSLVLQLLAVLAFVLALARPGFGIEQRPDHLILLLDRSVAMRATDGAGERFESAKTQAIEAARAMPSGTLLSLVVVDHMPAVAVARQKKTDQLSLRIESLRAVDVSPDWKSAAQAIAPLLRTGERTEVVALTGPESSVIARTSLQDTAPESAVGVVHVSDTVTSNARLVGVTARSLDADGRWEIEGQIAGTNLGSRTVPLKALVRPLHSEGFLDWGTSEVRLDRRGDAPFKIALEVPGPSLLELRLPEELDSFPTDDRFLVPLTPPNQVAVLLVGPDNPALERALLAIPDLALHRSESVPPDSERFDLVLIDSHETPVAPRTSTVWFGVDPVNNEYAQLEEPQPTWWTNEHPLAAGLDGMNLQVLKGHALPVLPGADVLIASGIDPLVQARTTDNGRQVVVSFDIRDSNWPAQLGFPAFIAALVDWAVPDRELTDRGAVCEVGRPCKLPRSAFAGGWLLRGPSGEVVAEPFALRPLATDGLAQGVWPLDTFDLQFRPDRAGVYRLESVEGEQMALLPVNANTEMEALGSRASVEVSEWSADAADVGTDLTRMFIVLAVLLLIAEATRAGLLTEGFLQATSFTVPNRGRSVMILVLLGVSIGTAILGWRGTSLPVLEPRYASATIVPVSEGDEERRRGAEDAEVRFGGWDSIRSSEASSGLTPVTDPEHAIELALASISGRDRRTVRFEDAPKSIDAESYNRLARRLSPDVEFVPMPKASRNPGNPSVVQVILPERVRAGDSVKFTVAVRNDENVPLRLEGNLAGTAVFEAEVDSGGRRIDVEFDAPATRGGRVLGLRLLRIDGEVAWSGEVGLDVGAPVSVLLLSDHEQAAARFAELLELQGIDVRVDLPRRLPTSLARLSPIDVVVLLDVPAIALHTAHQELLEEWVSSRGGGLVILGGEQSFGAGGYFRTPLEEVSPLSAKIPDELPEATLVFVLDRSGSMQGRVGELTRLDIAKAATVEAINLLAPESYVGIVAFDAEAETVSPIVALTEREAIEASVAGIRAGGGTSIYPALVRARDLFATVESATRHVIVMTDGLSQPGDFDSVLRELRAMGVTTSFVGIGDGADRVQLTQMAEVGGGSFHMTRDVRALPSIMAQETMQLASDPVEEGSIAVRWSGPQTAFLRGIAVDPPPLHGRVRTTLKPEASVHLEDEAGDAPLLASWRYGVGRVVAFASQPVGPWAREWNGDEGLQGLWPQAVRWTAGEVRRSGLALKALPRGSLLLLRVDAADDQMAPLTNLPVRVQILHPERDEVIGSVRLHEFGPGRYEGQVRVEGQPRTLRVHAQIDGEGPQEQGERVVANVIMPSPLTAAPDWTRSGPDLVRLSTAGAARNQRFPFSGWRFDWSANSTGWISLAVASFLATLALRYRPGLWPAKRGVVGIAGVPRETRHSTRKRD